MMSRTLIDAWAFAMALWHKETAPPESCGSGLDMVWVEETKVWEAMSKSWDGPDIIPAIHKRMYELREQMEMAGGFALTYRPRCDVPTKIL